jgi:hypothetical protein
MSHLSPTTPENCRLLAIECGRRANRHWARGETGKARSEVERARDLTLLALHLEKPTTNTQEASS